MALIENAIVIPARLESTRLPKKLLLLYKGKPLIQHAVEQALKSEKANIVILLYDNPTLVASIAKNEYKNSRFSAWPILEAINGTHRLQQFIQKEQSRGRYYRNIVLLQADIIDGQTGRMADIMFDMLEQELNEQTIQTFIYPLQEHERENKSIVKLLSGEPLVANYFTRHYVPGAFKHIGIYGFSNVLMNKFHYFTHTYKANQENLEQMAWIEAGFQIGYGNLSFMNVEDLGKSIDTLEDYNGLIANTSA